MSHPLRYTIFVCFVLYCQTNPIELYKNTSTIALVSSRRRCKAVQICVWSRFGPNTHKQRYTPRSPVQCFVFFLARHSTDLAQYHFFFLAAYFEICAPENVASKLVTRIQVLRFTSWNSNTLFRAYWLTNLPGLKCESIRLIIFVPRVIAIFSMWATSESSEPPAQTKQNGGNEHGDSIQQQGPNVSPKIRKIYIYICAWFTQSLYTNFLVGPGHKCKAKYIRQHIEHHKRQKSGQRHRRSRWIVIGVFSSAFLYTPVTVGPGDSHRFSTIQTHSAANVYERRKRDTIYGGE